ncbi:hypothetical protein ABEB36_004483 [Hypothenemus hampei]|uniref:Uncharacterized protein n=1 Tax=Hypothenemus hampei TaxID=57062 RepID=A0ABD1F665_HYPHA
MDKRKTIHGKIHGNEEDPKRLKMIDSVIENSSNQEFYSNYNIRIILAHYFKDKILDVDVDIIARNNNKTQKEQWLKQEKRHIRKLKIDLDKFESKSLQDKFYIIGTKDSESQITSAAIIRCFLRNQNIQVGIIPLINYTYSIKYNGSLNHDEVIMEYMNNTPAKKSCGLLIKKKSVMINKFMEILKIKIEGILNQDTNIEEKINSILQEEKSAEDCISLDKEIVAQYLNCEHDPYDIEEGEEELTILAAKTEKEENTGLTVENKKSSNKKVSWSSSVIENEMGSYRVRDRVAIEMFTKALHNWDIELFRKAKDESVDFHGLLNYLENEIKFEFWGDFYINFGYKLEIVEETNSTKKIIKQKKYDEFVNKVADGYNFLMDNMPAFLDKMQIEQDFTISSLPEDRKQHEGADFIKVIANDIRHNAIITNMINFVKVGAIVESHSYSMYLKIVEVEEQKYNNCNHDENLIAFITETSLALKEAFILRYSILFEKHLLKDFKDNSNIDASINALLMSERTIILNNIPACERPQTLSMEDRLELNIIGINLLKDNKKGAALVQHSRTQTAKLVVHGQGIRETEAVQMIEHIRFSMADVSITDEKLSAQMLHYLRTGDAFKSVRSTMENGTVSIIIQPSTV